ncbi:NADH-quinone oxidoreductase subunit M [Faunimonas sp. B44]|uniref:NADH-quinone oxidoreductase subunit M n=1 Tax=Faunimonas sp. B44 TaxID=3461493 RepID=UPI004044CB3A
MYWPILSTVTFLPLVGAAIILLFIHGDEEVHRRNIRHVALGVTTVTFLVSLMVWMGFDAENPGFQFVEEANWFGGFMSYRMGVDGISMLFVILTTFLMPFCILASWESIENRVKEYMIAFLVLETLMIGVFCALDIVLFYVFFEGGLIPMFLIIGVWGGPRRVYSAFKFFLYTLLGSVLMLLAIMAMYWEAGTTSIPELLQYPFPASMQNWLWLAFFASFAVKMPMWPVHTWLPDAHVEAPTAGSVVLAAILLKMGGYGFLRFSIPMFPLASADLAPLVFALSVIAIIYTSLVALMQEDMKKLIAYSSVAHMGFVTMGIFTGTMQGVQGGIFQMLSHGLVSGALFLCVGVIYDRLHTRQIDAYGGLVNRMPWFAVAFMVFTMANVGLPGTSGFVGEFLTLVGAFQANTWVAVFAATGVILSAGYALWLYRRVVFGQIEKESLRSILDMGAREKAILVPLILLTIFFGVYPAALLDVTTASVANLVNDYHAAINAAGATAAVLAH